MWNCDWDTDVQTNDAGLVASSTGCGMKSTGRLPRVNAAAVVGARRTNMPSAPATTDGSLFGSRVAGIARQSVKTGSEPWADFVEQPMSNGIRFRYKCEGRCAGSIPGEFTSEANKTYPTIKVGTNG